MGRKKSTSEVFGKIFKTAAKGDPTPDVPLTDKIVPPTISANDLGGPEAGIPQAIPQIDPTTPTGQQAVVAQQPLNLNDLFASQQGVLQNPGVNTTPNVTPINKGTYSGKTFSAPIFTFSGGFAPPRAATERGMSPEELKQAQARQKAEQEALADVYAYDADKQMINRAEFNENFHNQLIEKTNKFIENARFKYGNSYYQELIPGGREYEKLQKLQRLSYEVPAHANRAIDSVIEMQEKVRSGEMMISNKTKKMFEDYFNLTGEFAGADPDKLIGMGERIVATKNIHNIIAASAPKLNADISQRFDILAKENGQERVTTTMTKGVRDDVVNTEVDRLFDLADWEEFGITKTDLKSWVKNYVKDTQYKQSTTVQGSTDGGGDGDGNTPENTINTAGKEIQVGSTTTNADGTTSVNQAPVTSMGGTTYKPVSVKPAISSTTHRLDGSKIPDDAQVLEQSNSEVQVYPIYKFGSDKKLPGVSFGQIVPDEKIQEAKELGILEYEPIATSKVKMENPEYDEDNRGAGAPKQFLTEDVYQFASEIKGALEQAGQNIEPWERRAAELNRELQGETTPPDNKPAPTQGITQEEFNIKWAELAPGDTLTGPDGITYQKQ